MSKVVRYSDADLQEFKIIILEKLDTSKKELNYLLTQISNENANTSDQSSDYFDSSSRHTEIEMMQKMAARQKMFISNLENALRRIENKTYGICNITGTLISKERLKIVPHATKSIQGKENRPEKRIKITASKNGKPKIISKTKTKIQKKSTSKIDDENIDQFEIEAIPKSLIEKDLDNFSESD